MGIAEEPMETESETNNWVIAGIQFMTPLKPIYTKKRNRKRQQEEHEDEEEEREYCTTPTSPESRIPELKCPGAPRKRKSVSRSHWNGVRVYFKPPELESVFLRCVERA
ncbi:hypothetical protein R6Q57_014982 [Mikania cordata]